MPLSPDHPNAVRVRDAYEKWFAGVISPMMQLLADDVVNHLPRKYLGGGEAVGFDALLARAREYSATYDGPSRSEILEVVANDDFAITTEHHTARRNGHKLDEIVCGVWRFRDGRAVELWAMHSDPETLDLLWP